MITVIPMAGKSQRFYDAGYTTPKPLLLLPNSNTILSEQIHSLAPEFLLTISLASLRRKILPELLTIISHVECDHEFIWLQNETIGALDTLYKSNYCLHKHDSESMLISYCDVLFSQETIQAFLKEMKTRDPASGMIIFHSSDPRFGYWDGKNVVEKSVVSYFAVSGLFYFKTVEIFINQMLQVLGKREMGVPSALINPLPFMVEEREVIDLGTPRDYEDYCRKVSH